MFPVANSFFDPVCTTMLRVVCKKVHNCPTYLRSCHEALCAGSRRVGLYLMNCVVNHVVVVVGTFDIPRWTRIRVGLV